MKMSLPSNFFTTLFIFCMGLLLFTFALGHQEIVGFESRFYLFALTMWRHGATWFPTINGAPYPDYPPTPTLLIYGFAKLVGHLNKWTAVFPSAVAAAVTLATTYLIGALQSRLWGWYAVCLLILTNMFLIEARTISPDQYVAMVTTLVFYLVASAQLLQKNARLLWVPILLLFSFACRGPIGLVVPAGVLCMFYLTGNEYRKFFCAGIVAALLLVLGCCLLYWVAAKAGGVAFAQHIFKSQISGRLMVMQVPWYFYFSESSGAYAITYPLAVLMLFGWFGREKVNSQQKFLLQLVNWALVILIGMSIPAGKKIRYILAFAPALALICAYLFAVPQRQKYWLALRNVAYWVCYFLPMLCFAAMLVVEVTALQQHWRLPIVFPALFGLFLTLQWLCWISRNNTAYTLGIAALTFVMIYVLVIEPINLMSNQTQHFVLNLEVLRKHDHAQLAFYQQDPDGLPIKYVVNMPAEEPILYLEQPAQLAGLNTRALFVTTPQQYATIPLAVLKSMMIVTTGKLGHDPVVVFEQSRN